MPSVSRDAYFQATTMEAFHEATLWGKICQVATILTTVFCFVLPQELPIALGWSKPRLNVKRLKTVVEGQIYQQLYFGGQTQSTIFKNRKGNGLLIYSPPRITSDFVQDVTRLGGTVQYILVPNECHESFAEDAKKAFGSQAKVITPKPSRTMVQEAVPIDDTLENCWQVLEDDFGFVKMFRYDDNSRCTAERSYCIELFATATKDDDNDKKKQYCLFVGQCGLGHYSTLAPKYLLAGFQNVTTPRGCYFRHYYYCFTTKPEAPKPYWTHMVQSIPDTLQAAVFLHGDPIVGPNTRAKLEKFKMY